MDTGGEGRIVQSLDINMNVNCAGISQKLKVKVKKDEMRMGLGGEEMDTGEKEESYQA